MTANRPEWLTIAQVCEELQITEAEWNAWRAAGDTPLHMVMPGGQLRVRAADFVRWLDGLADDAPEAAAETRTRTEPDPYGNPYAYGNPRGFAPFRPLSAYWCQRIRDAIDASGARGLMRSEIWALTRRRFSLRQVNDALAELLASGAYEETTERTGAPGRPPVIYRRRKPSHQARADASRLEYAVDARRLADVVRDASGAAGSNASVPAGHDASRGTAAGRDGYR